jgi:hypothetical protein
MKLGDHVRALVNGEYRHGIDCGDRTVLFLGRDASGRPEVRRALAADFATGAERVETVVHRERALAPRVVVARAFSRMRDPAAAASFASSEAFAAWCLTGRPPEPGYAPAAAPARATRSARRPATNEGKPARKAPASKAVPKRKARKTAARSSAAARARKKAPARRPASPRQRRR